MPEVASKNGRAAGVWLMACLLVFALALAHRAGGKPAAYFPHTDTSAQTSADEALRRTIARAIYGHPAFWQEAARPEPPIQIVVHAGNVTLTGTVDGEIERALACSLATGHGEVSMTNHLRTRAAKIN